MERVDLHKVGLINQALKEGKKPSELLKTDANREFLFWYVVYCFVQNREFKILTEVQASEKLKQFPQMEVYYCKFPNIQTPMPGILKNRRGLQTVEISSHEQESEFIIQKTGVMVKPSDLMAKKAMAPDTRPLALKIRTFCKSVEDQKESDETTQRIYKCLLLADKKERQNCLNNCKTK
ncbi:MAG TPA: hypothetical protein VIK14_16345 [Ignavibacteria bacterium]